MDKIKELPFVLPFFSGLTDQEKTELLKAASFRHVLRGETVFLVGDALTHVYWVYTGAVQEYRETPDGHELTAAIRIKGDALFDPDAQRHKRVHVANTRALQDSVLLALPMTWIDTHIKSWDHLANKFIELLAARAQESQIETEHQATFSAAQIVACFLQHLCVTHRFDPRGFTLPYTKSVIASRLGMELESLSRALPKLREFGILVQGKQVSFTNIPAMQDFSCGHCSVGEDCAIHKALQEMAVEAPRKTLEAAG